MKSKLKFDLADLELTETESGILVQQDGREYLARKWKLGEENILLLDEDFGLHSTMDSSSILNSSSDIPQTYESPNLADNMEISTY